LTEQKATNITWHAGHVERGDRERLLGQRGVTVWLTGLSGSGKSTIAVAAEKACSSAAPRLRARRRQHPPRLNKNLGFSPADRTENIRRIGEVAKLFTEAGVIVMTSFISPYRATRDAVRAIMGKGDFVEVHVEASVETCEGRDVKGLYKKARAGRDPRVHRHLRALRGARAARARARYAAQSVEESVAALVDYLDAQGYLGRS
jgi:adenylylsulfate kinase